MQKNETERIGKENMGENEHKREIKQLSYEEVRKRIKIPEELSMDIQEKDSHANTDYFLKNEEEEVLDEARDVEHPLHNLFLNKFENCTNYVAMYNSEVKKLETKQQKSNQKRMGVIAILWSVVLIVLYLVVAKNTHLLDWAGNHAMTVLIIPVTALFAYVYYFLLDETEEKERMAYQWMKKNVISAIYVEFQPRKYPSETFQKELILLFPNGKKISYKKGMIDTEVEIYEIKTISVEETKKKEEYVSFEGLAVYDLKREKMHLYENMFFFPQFIKGETIGRDLIWHYYSCVKEIIKNLR